MRVGYEISYAERFGKRIICVYDETVRIGAMIAGNPNCELISYHDMDDLISKLKESL